MKFWKEWLDRKAIALAARAQSRIPLPPAPEVSADLLDDPRLFTAPSRTPNLVTTDHGRFQFPSELQLKFARTNTVYGRLFQIQRAAPTVVLVHGWNAELHYLFGFPRLARRLNRHGLNAIMFELPFHLQRRPTGASEMRDFIWNDLEGMLNATRQALVDIESLLRWTTAQGSSATAVWGFSLGAWLAGLQIAHSSTASAAVLTTPVSDLALAIETLAFCSPIRSVLEARAFSLQRLNLTNHIPQIRPEDILVMESMLDQFVPAHTYPDLAMKWKLPAWQKVSESHISVLFSRRSMQTTVDWLAQRLLRHSSSLA